MVLYTTGCPNCKLLERTLTKINITYEKISDFNVDEIISKSGVFSAPILFYEDKYYNFYESMKLIKELAEAGKI